LGDFVWVDMNHDGQQQPGEPGVPGVRVTLYQNGVPAGTATTNASGFYSFTNLTPGVAYSVSFGLPGGFAWTLPTVGITTTDSNVDRNGNTTPVTLGSGEFNPTLDAGVISTLKIDKVGVGSGEFNPTLDAGVISTLKIDKVGVGSGMDGAIGSDRQITYTILVTNTGAGAMSNVTVNDPLNQNMSYLRSVQTPPSSTNPLKWNLGTLNAGEVKTIVFVVNAIVNTGILTNVAFLNGSVGTMQIVLAEDAAMTPFAPNAVTLLQFTAEPVANGVAVVWETGSELNTFGFALYRAETHVRSQAILVSGEMIPAVGASRYTFVDASAEKGKTYHYWLIEVETTGAVLEYGPATVNAGTTAPQTAVQALTGVAVAGNVAVPGMAVPGMAVPGLPATNNAAAAAPVALPASGTSVAATQTRVGVVARTVNSVNNIVNAPTSNGVAAQAEPSAAAMLVAANQPADASALPEAGPAEAGQETNTSQNTSAAQAGTANSKRVAASNVPAAVVVAVASDKTRPAPTVATQPAAQNQLLVITGIIGGVLLLMLIGFGGLALVVSARKRRS